MIQGRKKKKTMRITTELRTVNYVLVLLCTIKNVVVPLKIKEIYIISNNRYSLHCMHILFRGSGVNETLILCASMSFLKLLSLGL